MLSRFFQLVTVYLVNPGLMFHPAIVNTQNPTRSRTTTQQPESDFALHLSGFFASVGFCN
jgi:hypothetical protein